MLKALFVCAAWLGSGAPAFAQTANDGDSLRLRSQSVHLYGIDAPELRQTCGDWEAGKLAREALEALVKNRRVECMPRDRDRSGRMIAVCTVDGRDIGAEMVRAGMALALTMESTAYVDQEAEAKAAGRGMHGRACEAPWDYRARLQESGTR